MNFVEIKVLKMYMVRMDPMTSKFVFFKTI